MGSMIEALANYDPNELANRHRVTDAQLAASQANTALTQEQTQQEGIKTQLMQQQLRDADIMRRAYVNVPMTPADTADSYHRKLTGYMISNGMSAPSLMDYQKQSLDLQKRSQDLTNEQNAAAAANLDRVGQTLGDILQMPEARRPAALASVTPQLRQWEPGFDWSRLPTDDESLSTHRGVAQYMAKLHEQQAKTAESTATAAEKIATAAEKTATTAQTRLNTAGTARAQAIQQLNAIDPDNPGADYARWAAAHPEMNPPPQYNPAWAQRQVRSTVPGKDIPEFDINTYKARMGLVGNSEYDQFLARYAAALGKTPATLSAREGLDSFGKFAELKQDPVMRANAIAMKQLTEAQLRLTSGLMPTREDIEVQTDALLSHRLSPTQFNELKTSRASTGAKVFSRAMQKDPNFSLAKAESEFKAMEKTEADFTSGKEAGLVRSNNNALEHLDMLDRARVALRNSDLPALNRIANWLGVQTGSSAATVFDHIASRVGDEVSKAFIPGGGGQAERKEAGAGSYASKMGDAQISANIRGDVGLLDSQQRHLADQYKRGTYGQGSQQLYTEGAMAARDRLLGRQAAAPQGTPTAQQAPTGVPNLPATLTQSDVGKTYWSRKGKKIKIDAVSPDGKQMKATEVP